MARKLLLTAGLAALAALALGGTPAAAGEVRIPIIMKATLEAA